MKRMIMSSRETKMNGKSIFMALFALTLLSAIPDSAFAKEGYSGSVTVGAERRDQDTPSFKSGEYDGVDDDATHFIGDADITYRKDNYYMDFRAGEVGHDSRSIGVESGRYGRYRFFLEYDQLPHLINDTGVTPFLGAGSGNLTLPGFINLTTATTDMNLTNLGRVDLETERKTGTVGYQRTLREGLDLALRFKREEKKGTKEIAGVMGSNGGNGRAASMPEPVDYRTDEINLSLEYKAKKGNVRLDYFLSRFENKIPTLSWESPYRFKGFQGPAEVYDTGADPTGRLALSPDNQHQRLSLSGGCNLSETARLSVIAEAGRMEQDEALLPYSVYTDTSLLPRKNAAAEIETRHLGLNLTGRPLQKLKVAAKYRYYETNNKMPRELFRYIKNDDADNRQAAENGDYALNANPFDSKTQQLGLDANYRVSSLAAFNLGFQREEIDRDYREVKKTEENTYKAGVKVNSPQAIAISLDYLHARRLADGGYDHRLSYETYHSPTYFSNFTASIASAAFGNHPDIRKFDIADRERDRIGVNLTVFSGPETTVSLIFSGTDDRYDNSIFGLQESDSRNYTVDFNRTLSEHALFYAFYTNEAQTMTQASRYYMARNTNEKINQSSDPNRNWSAVHDDNNDTVGIGTKLNFLDDDLVIEADYSYSSAKTDIRFTAGSALAPPVDMPQLQTRLNTLDVTGRYRFDKRLTLGLGYNYERYRADNWSTDGFDPGTAYIPWVLTLSGSVPDYDAHLVQLFATYDF